MDCTASEANTVTEGTLALGREQIVKLMVDRQVHLTLRESYPCLNMPEEDIASLVFQKI